MGFRRILDGIYAPYVRYIRHNSTKSIEKRVFIADIRTY